jgi:hypothetical protein
MQVEFAGYQVGWQVGKEFRIAHIVDTTGTGEEGARDCGPANVSGEFVVLTALGNAFPVGYGLIRGPRPRPLLSAHRAGVEVITHYLPAFPVGRVPGVRALELP